MSVTSHGPEPCASAYSAISASSRILSRSILLCQALSKVMKNVDFKGFSSVIWLLSCVII